MMKQAIYKEKIKTLCEISKVLFAQENTPSLMFLKLFISYHGIDAAQLEHLKQPYNLNFSGNGCYITYEVTLRIFFFSVFC